MRRYVARMRVVQITPAALLRRAQARDIGKLSASTGTVRSFC